MVPVVMTVLQRVTGKLQELWGYVPRLVRSHAAAYCVEDASGAPMTYWRSGTVHCATEAVINAQLDTVKLSSRVVGKVGHYLHNLWVHASTCYNGALFFRVIHEL